MPTLLQLAERQRRSQDRLRRLLEVYLRMSWLRSARLIDAAPAAVTWIALVAPVIMAYRAQSEGLARVSYAEQRALVDSGAVPTAAADGLDYETLAISLRATALAGLINRLNAGVAVSEALQASAEEAAGAGVRHALDGGRSYLQNVVERDVLAVGWYRVTKDGPCYFCAILASRGAVYKGDSFDESDPRFIGDGTEKVHDHCACTLAPIYSREQPVGDRNREFETLWRSIRATQEDVDKGRATTVGQRFSGDAALRAFRRKYESLYPQTRG